MTDVNIIKNIIDISVYAPSGDNAQPWRFEIREGVVFVYNIPERDNSIYNFNMSASYISLGALIENIKVASTHYGYKCEVDLDENETSNLVAKCYLSQSGDVQEDYLFKFIKKRATNRKPYRATTLSSPFLLEIKNYRKFFPDNFRVNFVLTDNKDLVKTIAEASSANEQIVLENKDLHDFLFSHITWTEKEDEEKKGFFLKTLEMKGPQQLVFKILKSWKILRFLNKLGISKIVAKENSKIYSKSKAMLAITIDSLDKISFLETGMLMQRLWLLATKNNIYAQPLTGIVFLRNRLEIEGESKTFNPNHEKIIKNSYNVLEKSFDVKNKRISMILRLGYADKPTAFTKRLKPNIGF